MSGIHATAVMWSGGRKIIGGGGGGGEAVVGGLAVEQPEGASL